MNSLCQQKSEDKRKQVTENNVKHDNHMKNGKNKMRRRRGDEEQKERIKKEDPKTNKIEKEKEDVISKQKFTT